MYQLYENVKYLPGISYRCNYPLQHLP